jgi:choline kinase
MQAIMYAAGVGIRLKPTVGTIPKILLEFGGKTLLEWHAQRLGEAGVERLTVVTGYEYQLVDRHLARLREHHRLELRSLVNPLFNEGSVLSMAASIPVLQSVRVGEPVLLMDGDVLYPSQFLPRLIGSPHRTALLIDRNYSTTDDDPVLVPIAGGKPFDFVKRWKGEADIVGESIGFFKMAHDDLPDLIDRTLKMSAAARSASLDDVLRQMVQAGRFGHEDVTGLPWIEIDFPTDVERAAREVLPAIAGL